jgi:hypothetical protein
MARFDEEVHHTALDQEFCNSDEHIEIMASQI